MEIQKRWPTRDELEQFLLGRLSDVLFDLFPEGKVVNNTFFIGNVKGDEGKSLRVELRGNNIGLWNDFATIDGGDIVSLWGAAHGWNDRRHFPDIVRSVEERFGMIPVPASHRNINARARASEAYTPEARVPETHAPKAQAPDEQTPPSEPLGKPTGKWAYEDVDANNLAWCYRYDPSSGKKIRYQDARTRQWKVPPPRPLYNQPGIARSDSVVLVEGEKCAAALVNMGICATTAMNGANAIIDKTDWSPLIGKHVLVWPDNDIPGKSYADRVIKKLASPDLKLASLSLMDIPESRPDKWDVADAIDEGMDIKVFMDACSQHVSLIPEPEDNVQNRKTETIEPLPLRKKLEAATDYPIDALGDLLGGAALDIHDAIQAPLAICAQSVLANAALAVQGHIDIKLPFGHISPTSLYLISISESGGRKSASDREASDFIKIREKELWQKHDKDLANYINKKDVYDAMRRKIMNSKSTHQDDMDAALKALGEPPTPPLDPLLTVPEPTYEGICGYFMKGQPSIGLFSDEGGQFLSGHGMNVDNKIKTAAGLSNLWGGEAVKRMRKGDGTVILPGKRFSMHLMLQPGVVERLLSDPELLQQGILARLLVVYPPHLFGTRFSTNKKTRDGNAVKEFNAKMLEIARKELPINPESGRNELTPRVLEMTPEAEAAFYRFSDHIEGRLKDGYDLESLRGFCSKLAEQASRIASVIAYAENPEIPYLQKHDFERGAILAEYYAREALRLFGNAIVPEYILEAESLLEWLKDSWPSKTKHPNLVTLPDVCIFGPNKLRRKVPATNALKTLEDHGWLVKEKSGTIIDGKRCKDVWRIRREYFDAHVSGREEVPESPTLEDFSHPGIFEPERELLPSNQNQGISLEDGSSVPSPHLLETPPISPEINVDAEEWEGINICYCVVN